MAVNIIPHPVFLGVEKVWKGVVKTYTETSTPPPLYRGCGVWW
jgi:hypothetical protein